MNIRSRCAGGYLTAVALIIASSAAPALAETRSFAISSFTAASYNQDGDCSKGINLSIQAQNDLELLAAGYSKEQVEAWAKNEGGGAAAGGQGRGKAIRYRGKIKGESVSVWVNPASTSDPQLNMVDGKYALGFNLDGKGEASPNGFENPLTHEKGVNNQMFRAMGCFTVFRGDDKVKPTAWISAWDIVRAGMPAWMMSITGADLSKDGDVTVAFDRAVEHVERDAQSEVLRDMTFRINPDPRSHAVFKGQIKDRVLTLTEAGVLRAAFGEEMLFPELVLSKTHMRLEMKPDGSLSGVLGGYQPWKDTYSSSWYANGGSDQVGLYYLLRKAADANPDPKTGENTDISTAYMIEAVPAFVVTPSKNKVATR